MVNWSRVAYKGVKTAAKGNIVVYAMTAKPGSADFLTEQQRADLFFTLGALTGRAYNRALRALEAGERWEVKYIAKRDAKRVTKRSAKLEAKTTKLDAKAKAKVAKLDAKATPKVAKLEAKGAKAVAAEAEVNQPVPEPATYVCLWNDVP